MSPDFIPRSGKSCHAKIGPSQNWSHGPLLADKSGLGPFLAAKG